MTEVGITITRFLPDPDLIVYRNFACANCGEETLLQVTDPDTRAHLIQELLP